MPKFNSYADVIREFVWLPLALSLNQEDAILRLLNLIDTVHRVEMMDAREIEEIFREGRVGHA